MKNFHSIFRSTEFGFILINRPLKKNVEFTLTLHACSKTVQYNVIITKRFFRNSLQRDGNWKFCLRSAIFTSFLLTYKRYDCICNRVTYEAPITVSLNCIPKTPPKISLRPHKTDFFNLRFDYKATSTIDL